MELDDRRATLQRRVVVQRCSYSTSSDSSVEAGSWLGDGGPRFPSGLLHWQTVVWWLSDVGSTNTIRWLFFLLCVFLQIERVMTMGLIKKNKSFVSPNVDFIIVLIGWDFHSSVVLTSAKGKVCLCQYALWIVFIFFLSCMYVYTSVFSEILRQPL